jgi:hypothetical protein
MNRCRFVLRLTFSTLLLMQGFTFAQTNCERGAGPLRTEKPTQLTPPEIVQRFTANETMLEAARGTYSFRQDVVLQTLRQGVLPGDWHADGEFRLVMDITHDDHGKPLESVLFAPQSSLHRISVEREDMEDIRHFSTFALTTEELPRYTVLYAGQQHVDELDTFVFDVAPKRIEKGRRYFQGRIWVGASDLKVVKTCGRSVPDIVVIKKKRVVESSVQPKFATYRELIDGKYWFPTYSRSDDVLDFGRDNEVRLRETIRFINYKSLRPGTAMASSK